MCDCYPGLGVDPIYHDWYFSLLTCIKNNDHSQVQILWGGETRCFLLTKSYQGICLWWKPSCHQWPSLICPVFFHISSWVHVFFLNVIQSSLEIQQNVPLQKISKVTKVQDFVAHSHRLHPWHDKFCRGKFPDFLSPQNQRNFWSEICWWSFLSFLPFWILISFFKTTPKNRRLVNDPWWHPKHWTWGLVWLDV